MKAVITKLYRYGSAVFVTAVFGCLNVFGQGAILQLSVSSLRVSEASGQAIVTLLRSGDTNQIDVTFSTMEGSAQTNIDFVPAAGTITFGAGETNKTVSVDLIDDSQRETDESFQIQFTASPDVQWQGASTATVAIEDEDRAGGVDVSLPTAYGPVDGLGPEINLLGFQKIALGTHGEIAVGGTNNLAFVAVREAFEVATGELLFILDADLTMPPEQLPKFYEAARSGAGEFINGVRLVYPMEDEAMQFLNMVANKFFGVAFSWLLRQQIKDTLCGTKVLFRRDYDEIARNRSYFGDFDPFGDFDLIFGAAKLNLKILDLPIRYQARTYGETNINRWRHGALLLRMVAFAARRLKFI